MGILIFCNGPGTYQQLPCIDYWAAAHDPKGRTGSMGKGTKETNPANDKVKLEKKYIRLQGVGISFLVAIPVAVFLLFLFDIYVYLTVVMTIFIMATSGVLCLQLGDEKRNALRANKKGGSNDSSN